ncbi:unnamed protein product (macronuclear) [Paramecium tetraurelia]|uniref:WD40-repeat-containing domain n=1 Tax=Paramecium tetraurelia TaxID=5888 RepID=A0EBW8_PARTE|nr:uncharacterized protein GSPATT00025520001 [Paramecium tetraurelia]CAK92785.1 unnamed protein product [Paramecium tetraurelia]|eukprot:XP_001460182.1 hypothetical protein (macronuclear) [Paramecium tetraurelia strain d4-2]
MIDELKIQKVLTELPNELPTKLPNEFPIYEGKSQININFKARCYAMAINSSNNLLLVGSGYYIKIFGITKNFTQNELQDTKVDDEIVFCLKFLPKSLSSNSFISATDKIIIWQEQNLKWHTQQYLIAEMDKSPIKCLVIHPQEDLIICGSQKYIQFWYKNLHTLQGALQNNQQEWICETKKNSDTQGLSINQNGDTLISCSFTNEIRVFKGSNRQEWIEIKKMDTNYYGLRLCFITNDVMAFQERESRPHDKLNFYSLNSQDGQGEGIIEVKGGQNSCNSLFPLIYVPSKQLIIDKNGYFINIIRIEKAPSQKYQIKQIQYIGLNKEYIYGTASDDGNLLIFWNEEQYQVQVRRYIDQT